MDRLLILLAVLHSGTNGQVELQFLTKDQRNMTKSGKNSASCKPQAKKAVGRTNFWTQIKGPRKSPNQRSKVIKYGFFTSVIIPLLAVFIGALSSHTEGPNQGGTCYDNPQLLRQWPEFLISQIQPLLDGGNVAHRNGDLVAALKLYDSGLQRVWSKSFEDFGTDNVNVARAAAITILKMIWEAQTDLGRHDDALSSIQNVYEFSLSLYGENDLRTLRAALHLGTNLGVVQPPRTKEATQIFEMIKEQLDQGRVMVTEGCDLDPHKSLESLRGLALLNLAELYYRSGSKLSEAKDLYKEILSRFMRAKVDRHDGKETKEIFKNQDGYVNYSVVQLTRIMLEEETRRSPRGGLKWLVNEAGKMCLEEYVTKIQIHGPAQIDDENVKKCIRDAMKRVGRRK